LLGEAQLNYVLGFKLPRNIKGALQNSVPSQLYDVYETVIETIGRNYKDSKELVRTILSWIYHAKRPLLMTELREALAVQEDDVSFDEDDLMSPDDIVEMCGSLITHEKETGIATFSHERVQDFL